jgi:hypothetical protein
MWETSENREASRIHFAYCLVYIPSNTDICKRVKRIRRKAGGPIQAWFWLEVPRLRSGSIRRTQDFGTRLIRRVAPQLSEAPVRPSAPVSVTRSLHSTDHRFAMICSGRDDRVGEILASPLKPKSGLSGPPVRETRLGVNGKQAPTL